MFLWDLEDGGFAGVVLLKKGASHQSCTKSNGCLFFAFIVLTPSDSSQPSGAWDSIHVFEASERGRQARYKLTSTIMLHLVTTGETAGEVNLSGSMTRQVEPTAYIYFIANTN